MTYTLPARRLVAAWRIRAGERENTPAVSAYSVSFARANAWSRSSARRRVSTGPKISSVATRASGRPATTTVGPAYQPPAGTSSRRSTTSPSRAARSW
ncbi:MAG: hypothetical protein M5U14_04430 [Acidimicrobiia bacterium]|nr:hypothetical protein [Acidimicrobiia bacterium]